MRVDADGRGEPPGGGAAVVREVGEIAPGDALCVDCGYGVSVRGRLPVCPMCGGRGWEDVRPPVDARHSPFSLT